MKSEAKELPQNVVQELVDLARLKGYDITELSLVCICTGTRGWLTIKHEPNVW